MCDVKLNDTFIRKWFISRTHTVIRTASALMKGDETLYKQSANHCWSSCFVTGTSVEVASSFQRWPFLCRSGERKRNDIVWLSASWETTSHKKQKDGEVAEEEEEEGLFFWLLSPHSAAAALLHRTNTCCPSATPREKSIALRDNLHSCVQRGETPLDVVKILWHPSSPCFALPLCHSTVFTHYLWFCFPLSALTLCFFAADFDLAVQKCFWNAPPPRPQSPVLYFPPEQHLQRSTSVQFCHNSLSPFCALVLECVSVCGLLQNSKRSWLHNSRVTLQ